MGQKVNPVGFRTGIMVGWKSRWYASKQEFADLLVEDQKIRHYIKGRKDKFGKPFYPSISRLKSSEPATRSRWFCFRRGLVC